MNVNRTKTLSIDLEKCSNQEFLLPQLKNDEDERNITQELSRGQETRKDMPKSAWRGTVNWHTKKDGAFVHSCNALLG